MKASLTSCAALTLIVAVSLGACTQRDENTPAPATSSSSSSTTPTAPKSDTSTSSSSTASTTTSQEVQRGAPGVGVDVGKDAQQSAGPAGVVVDTQASGAGAEMNLAEQRRLRTDRH